MTTDFIFPSGLILSSTFDEMENVKTTCCISDVLCTSEPFEPSDTLKTGGHWEKVLVL